MLDDITVNTLSSSVSGENKQWGGGYDRENTE